MKTTLKKKLTAAILAGCSTFILSGVALANPPQPPPPPPRPFIHNEDEQRLAKISEGTGISTERLQEIFSTFKDTVKNKLQHKIQD